MAARAELARGQLLVADVEEQQRLHTVDLMLVAAIQLVLDHVQQLTMQTFNQIESFEIVLAERLRAVERRSCLRTGLCCQRISLSLRGAHLRYETTLGGG